MDYNEALTYIANIPKFAYPLGNKQLETLLARLGKPQNKLRFIHIAGTNGKGSASAMLCEILTRAGYKTGLFTSPFIQRFNERIRIGTQQIDDRALADIVTRVSAEGVKVSQFAFILACAMVYYSEQVCDFVILEAGMGGRLDASNVIEQSVVSVIMSIGFDHTEYLGDTIEKIAEEKCGIIKKNSLVAAYRNDNAAAKVIEDECKKQSARLFLAPCVQECEGGFLIGDKRYRLGLEGEYQTKNAAAVLAVCDALRYAGVEIPDAALMSGLAQCRWCARFQRVRENVIIDGGHNPDGVDALCRSVDRIKGKKTAVVAMMRDKAVDYCIDKLLQSFDEIIVTEIDMPRCISAEELAKKAGNRARIITPCRKAFAAAEKCPTTAVICGSLYLAGQALDYFEGH